MNLFIQIPPINKLFQEIAPVICTEEYFVTPADQLQQITQFHQHWYLVLPG